MQRDTIKRKRNERKLKTGRFKSPLGGKIQHGKKNKRRKKKRGEEKTTIKKSQGLDSSGEREGGTTEKMKDGTKN